MLHSVMTWLKVENTKKRSYVVKKKALFDQDDTPSWHMMAKLCELAVLLILHTLYSTDLDLSEN